MARGWRGGGQRVARVGRRLAAAPRLLLRPFALAERAARRSRPGRWLTARRRALLLLSGLLLVAGGAVHLDRYPAIAQARADRAAEAALASGPAGSDAPGAGAVAGDEAGSGRDVAEAVLVGPGPTDDPATHVERRAASLERAGPGTDLAVVSFDRRRTPADAVAATAPGAVRALLVRLPDGPAIRVDLPAGADPDAALRDALAGPLARLASEAAELAQLLASGTVSDPDFETTYRDRVARLRRLLDAPPGPVVHAVLLQADLTVLRAVAATDGVRLVDPAPAGTDPATARAVGVEPVAD